MNNSKGKVQGVIVPIITPVDERENVDKKAFKAVIDHCIDGGVNGIFVGGSAGMGPLLGDDQWKAMVETAREHIQDRCILLGGVICTSTARAIERIKFLEKCGYRYMVVTPTYYITLNRDEQFLTHFRACRDATEMEMVIYNIPPCTHSQIPPAVLDEMARKELYRVIKESSADKSYFSQVVKIAEKYDLTVLQGNEADIEWGLSIGAHGIVPVCSNYEPQTFVGAYQAAQKGETTLLRQAQERIDFLRTNLLVKSENWIAGIMYGMATRGMGNGKPLRPLLEVSAKTKRNIESLLNSDDKKEVVRSISKG